MFEGLFLSFKKTDSNNKKSLIRFPKEEKKSGTILGILILSFLLSLCGGNL